MALLMFNGFDHLNNSWIPDLISQAGWVIGGNIFSHNKIAGLNGGFGVQLGSVNTPTFFYNSGVASTTLIVGLKFIANNGWWILTFNDSANAVQCGLNIDGNGRVYVYRGSTSNVLATGTRVLIAGSWYEFEIKVTFSDTGSIVVKVDGTTEINISGVDTTQTANQNGQYLWFPGGNNYAYDDLYLCDGTGAAPYNDFLGPCHIETLYPNANNSVTWTPLSSTNVSQVSEVGNDGDTSYNSTSTAGAVDTFSHPALSISPSTIYACAVFTSVRKDDATAQNCNNVLISGATTVNGANFLPATGYSWMVDQYINDPNTGAAWLAANVNATKMGYRHV